MSPSKSPHGNYYQTYGDYTVIFLVGPHGGAVTIDAGDIELILTHKLPWRLNAMGTVVAGMPGTNGNKIQLSRLIMNVDHEAVIQHLDDDKTNCRRDNLVIVHVKRAKRGTNRGVYYESDSGKWRATIMAEGNRKSLGRFDSLQEAVDARRSAEISLGIESGVFFDKQRNRWRARSKGVYIGGFKSKEAAAAAKVAYEVGNKTLPKSGLKRDKSPRRSQG